MQQSESPCDSIEGVGRQGEWGRGGVIKEGGGLRPLADVARVDLGAAVRDKLEANAAK